MNIDLKRPLKLIPNLQVEKEGSVKGYIWGKPAHQSNILKIIHQISSSQKNILYKKLLRNVGNHDLVAERWIVSDDRERSSIVFSEEGETPFYQLLESHGQEILGLDHLTCFGPFLGTVMKQVDTHMTPEKGSLSVQVHPEAGNKQFTSKPEMWKGQGQLYLGWNKDMTEDEVSRAVSEGNLEKFLNPITITDDDLVMVPGGLVHAIRFNTFLFEWSKAVIQEEIDRGGLNQATFALYDATDGKPPRPGKVDLENSFKVMKDVGGFLRQAPKFFNKRGIYSDASNNSIEVIFNTGEIAVEEFSLMTEIDISQRDRGFPLYVERGEVEVVKEGSLLDTIEAGEERFFPYSMGDFSFRAKGGKAHFFRWNRPFAGDSISLS